MSIWLASVTLTVAVICILKRYYSGGVCSCLGNLSRKVVIITGANSGIGKATAYILAKKGATIILACRNQVEGLRVAKEIRHSTENSFITYEHLDLTSFASICDFVDRLKKSGITEIYALVNNAGVFYHPFRITEDNFEVTFQTNYLGPFYLTISLFNDNFFNKYSRIINVVSEAHRFPKELNLKEVFVPNPSLNQFIRYGESKLCSVLFTKKLSTVQKEVAVFCVDPGNVETNVYRHFPLLNNKFLFALQKPLRWILVKTANQGAQSIVHTVINLDCTIHNGKYFRDCKVIKPSQLAEDQKLADELWYLSSLSCLLSPTFLKNVHETSK